jgi:hypothetical protein
MAVLPWRETDKQEAAPRVNLRWLSVCTVSLIGLLVLISQEIRMTVLTVRTF